MTQPERRKCVDRVTGYRYESGRDSIMIGHRLKVRSYKIWREPEPETQSKGTKSVDDDDDSFILPLP